MKVHNTLGNGFQEVIYQRCLEIEFGKNNVPLAREVEMPIRYEAELVGTRRVDFMVDGKVLVELKALIQLEDVHLAQAINYPEAFNLEVGLLINCGGRSLELKRLQNKKLKVV